MTVFIPRLPRWRCVICEAPTDQRHHLSYDRRLTEADVLVPLCSHHHERLHATHDAMQRRVPLAVHSAQYIADPARVETLAHIVPAAQLSLGQQATKQGAYWRTLEAQWAQLHEGFGEEEHEAA